MLQGIQKKTLNSERSQQNRSVYTCQVKRSIQIFQVHGTNKSDKGSIYVSNLTVKKERFPKFFSLNQMHIDEKQIKETSDSKPDKKRGRPINSSEYSVKLLEAIKSSPKGAAYGYPLSKKLEIAPGTLYPLLERLEDREFLSASWEENTENSARPRRCIYTLTKKGREYIDSFL